MSDEVRKVSRRSFLGKVLGGAAIGAVAIVGGATEAEAQRCTDRDPYDRVGGGRWCRRRRRRTGCTDRDPSDPGGNGRCGGRRRYRSGITDSDPGDPVGNGRGRGRRRSGITDSDPSDPVGNGRG